MEANETSTVKWLMYTWFWTIFWNVFFIGLYQTAKIVAYWRI